MSSTMPEVDKAFKNSDCLSHHVSRMGLPHFPSGCCLKKDLAI